MTAAAPPLLLPPPVPVTKLPFCNNNGSNRYSINVSAHRFFTCLCYIYIHAREKRNESSTPAARLIRYSKPSVQQAPSSEPCIHAGLSCTACHPQIRYYRSVIQFPALSANRKGKKKKKGKRKTDSNSPVLSSAVADNCAFTSSSF